MLTRRATGSARGRNTRWGRRTKGSHPFGEAESNERRDFLSRTLLHLLIHYYVLYPYSNLPLGFLQLEHLDLLFQVGNLLLPKLNLPLVQLLALLRIVHLSDPQPKADRPSRAGPAAEGGGGGEGPRALLPEDLHFGVALQELFDVFEGSMSSKEGRSSRSSSQQSLIKLMMHSGV